MRSTSKKLLGTVAVAGLVAAGGSAFTASNTLAGENVAGYGTATVVGANTTAIEHTLSNDGVNIASSALTFSADLPAGAVVRAGFEDLATVECVLTEGVDAAVDTAVCTYVADSVLTEASDSFEVSVS